MQLKLVGVNDVNFCDLFGEVRPVVGEEAVRACGNRCREVNRVGGAQVVFGAERDADEGGLVVEG